MTLTETIFEELVDSARDPVRIQATFQRFKGSKGPFYMGLAQATIELEKEFREAVTALSEIESDKTRKTEEVRLLDASLTEARTATQEVERSYQEVQARLGDAGGLLDAADELRGQGFGEEELRHLSEMLASIAASQGAAPEEGVSQFFETVGRFDKIVSFDLEARRAESRAAQAKADVDRWESEAQRAEAASKARLQTIDMTENLLRQGVKELDIVQWGNILATAGTNPADYRKLLKRYGGLEKVIREQQGLARTLRQQVMDENTELLITVDQKQEAAMEIKIIREKVVDEISTVANQARSSVRQVLGLIENGYGKGWGEAMSFYQVEFHCHVCGELTPLAGEKARKFVVETLEKNEWGHAKCTQEQTNGS